MADSVTGSSAVQINSNYDKYKEFFSQKDNSALDQSDFLKLMSEQLKNQDFQNPTDNTQFIAQMAQFSALQSQQQATYYTQASYAASLVGKNVAVADTDSNGKYSTDTGVVTSVRFANNDFELIVNGKTYKPKNIMEVKTYIVDGDPSAAAKSAIKSTTDVDLTKVSTLPELSGTPKITVGFLDGTQTTPITIKLINGDSDLVNTYTSGNTSDLTIALKDLKNITSTVELAKRINDTIAQEIANPTIAKAPIMTTKNFTAGKLSITVDSAGITQKDGTALTEANVSGIYEAAAKTITENAAGITLSKS